MEEQIICGFTGEKVDKSLCVDGFTIRPQILELIQKSKPDFDRRDWILESSLREFKLEYAENMLKDHELAVAVNEHDQVSDDFARTLDEEDPETLIDRIACFVSSHQFGVFIFCLVAGWVILNFKNGFDDYPFNLLDLVLGIIASYQALVIMMSQDKADKKDKQRMKDTLRVALKNEFEINIIREKIDHIKDIQVPYLLTKIKEK